MIRYFELICSNSIDLCRICDNRIFINMHQICFNVEVYWLIVCMLVKIGFSEKAKKSLIGAVKAGNMDIVKLLLDKDMNFLPNVNEKKVWHDNVIKWKHVPPYWYFVRGIHRSPVNSLHKGQWRGALMFSLICVRITGWANNREAGDLRRHRTLHDVIVMICLKKYLTNTRWWIWTYKNIR